MTRKIILTCVCALGLLASKAQQNFTTAPKKYKQAEVYNPDYGINIYEKLNFLLGGDSVRYDQGKGYAASGWREDFYDNGQLLHKGYYQEGQLKIYKNYFDNGQLEREFFVKPDPSKYKMKIFYRDGKPRSDIDYTKGNPVRWQEWYENGQTQFIEEYDKNMEYFIQRKTYKENGNPESLMEITDQKKKIYSKKEYHDNGKLKEEGSLKYDKLVEDYRKEGTWLIYDETGKLIEEEYYVKGELTRKEKK